MEQSLLNAPLIAHRIVFTPSVEVKDELKNTAIQITCLDENDNGGGGNSGGFDTGS